MYSVLVQKFHARLRSHLKDQIETIDQMCQVQVHFDDAHVINHDNGRRAATKTMRKNAFSHSYHPFNDPSSLNN